MDARARLVIRALRRYADDGMVERAPALAYYGILSLFPLLLIAFALMRLVAGADAPDELAAYVRREGASGAVAGALRSAAETARSASSPTAGAAGAAGLLTLVYGSSRAFTSAGRAMDAVAGRPAARRSLARRAQDIAWSLVVMVMVMALLVLLLLSGRVLEELLDLAGVDALGAWAVVRWPAAAVVALLIVAVVRWAAPTGPRSRFRLATPGAIASVALLIAATVAYDVYLTSFASYNTTYGTFAGGVILLLWTWLAAVAFLFGAELDAVLAERDAQAA